MKLSPRQKSNVFALVILGWGGTAMLGDVLRLPALKGLGLASAAAPYTKVFCQAEDRADGRKFETFAMGFRLHYRLEDGSARSMEITPEVYQNMRGPYQRRNVYGAVLAYGPALPERLRRNTLEYALAPGGAVQRELGVPEGATDFRIELTSRTRGAANRWVLSP